MFYNYWVGFGVLAVYLLVVYLIRSRYFPDTKKMWVGTILYFLVPFLWIMTMGSVNPVVLGYGRPTEIVSMKSVGGQLFVKDFIKSSGSKATFGSPYYRLHMIDPLTGKKKIRFLLGGSGSIMAVNGDSLIVEYSNAIICFSATTGKIVREWTKQTLPGIYPQLKPGIHDMEIDKERFEIRLTSLDGNKWKLNFITSSIMPDDAAHKTEELPNDKISLGKYGISVESKKHSARLMALCDKPGNEHQKILCGHKDSVLNNEEVFLDGKIIALSVKDSCFVVMHYETIAHVRVILTCMSLDGRRKMWELKQSMVLPNEKNDEPLKITTCKDEDNGLFFASFKEEIIAMQMKDGVIVWREIP